MTRHPGGKRAFKKRLQYQVLPHAAHVSEVKSDPVVAKDIIKSTAKQARILPMVVHTKACRDG